MKLKFLLALIVLINSITAEAQNNTFKIMLEPVSIPGLIGVQAFAYGQHEGKWLIVGGRLDGLHRRQPFASFAAKGNNLQLIVIDPVNLQKWYAPTTALSVALQEQLSATNMQYHQDGRYLYITGGYGFSGTLDDHTTYANLTAIDVPNTINAIINAAPLAAYFRQISDTAFAVTGGHLKKINNTYYLVGGQKFTGRYNPMGPDHGPGFFQQYTNQIRKFTIEDDGVNISVKNYQAITDAPAFHRRDYNVVAQILPDGAEGVSLFSGVFQPTANIPFLNSVTIDSNSYAINPSFAQYYNHYHCATLPLYSKLNNEMHTIFFGGIAQYYDSAAVLVQNSDVPFVKTIAAVTRDKAGNLSEYKLPVEMPGFLGAGAELILQPTAPQYLNEVIKLDNIVADTTLVGHIYGGITSTAPNIFWINTGEESHASNQLFKVMLVKNAKEAFGILNPQSNNGLQLQVYADVEASTLTLDFFLAKNESVELQITDANGKVLKREILKELIIGKNSIDKSIKKLKAGNTYWITLKTQNIQATQQLMIEPD
ncbi:hypothetical protein [Ferruginibacter sp.]|nr:T9SS type A sorting domain-containing protein [Ferruginibacter sp.]